MGFFFDNDEIFGAIAQKADATVYDSTRYALPPGSLTFRRGSRMPGQNDLGSFASFYGTAPKNQGGSGNVTGHPDSDGLYHGGFRFHSDGWWFNWDGDNQRPNAQEGNDLRVMSASSVNHGWGPLMGNPHSDDWRGMRLDAGTGQFFWLPTTAPAWAPGGAAANQEALDAQAAAAQAAANQQMLEQAAGRQRKRQTVTRTARQVVDAPTSDAHRRALNTVLGELLEADDDEEQLRGSDRLKARVAGRRG